MNKTLRILKNVGISAVIITAIYCLIMLLRSILHVNSIVPMLYVLGVFFIALLTDGYFYGIASAFASAASLLYIFDKTDAKITYAYNVVISIVIILFVAMLTCTLTTMLKKAKRIKEESIRENMVGNLMRAVSHDLRTPLTTIYASASAIVDNYDSLSEEQRIEIVNDIRTESQGLVHMLENTLTVTKVNAKNVTLTMTDTVLEELIDTVVVKFNRHYPSAPLTLDIPDEFVSIPMDAMLIEQVLFNLLENAVIHAQGMTELVLRVTLRKDKVCFEVRDNGCGIRRDKPNKIFDEYHSATLMENENISKRNMGIGLSVCRAIIRAHNSNIIASNIPDGGASFKFTLRRSSDE
ncbi:MAG: PAS domain-containing sensor histidine kinase [Clostridia bacterium]|nr:PAS domain-containing sensor histidine kinase [Clostridia bacterium]